MKSQVNRRALVEWAFDPSLFERGEKVLVAVSGGADSMVLLEFLANVAKSLELDLHALHVNFGLRGQESDRDERLVRRRCKELGVFLTIHEADNLSRSASNLEEKARDIRHKVLRETAQEIEASAIALGHTLDDQAETILMRVVRGSGTKGFAAMSSRDGSIVRPLLGVRREQVREYAKERGIAYREDASNHDLKFTRNRVRHILLPTLLKYFNPRVRETLVESADIMREDEKFLDELTETIFRRFVKEEPDQASIKAIELLDMPVAIQRRLIRAMLRSCSPKLGLVSHGKAVKQTLNVLKKSDGGMKFDLGAGLTLERKKGIVSLTLRS